MAKSNSDKFFADVLAGGGVKAEKNTPSGAGTGVEAALIPNSNTPTRVLAGKDVPTAPTLDKSVFNTMSLPTKEYGSINIFQSLLNALTGNGKDDQPPKEPEKPPTTPTQPEQPSGGGGNDYGSGGSYTDVTEEETQAEKLPLFEPGELPRDEVYGQLYGGLQDLRNLYDETMKVYEPKTQEQMQAQAEQEYWSYYDQLRLAAQQSQESQDLALQQQREGLQSSYDKARDASLKQYAQTYSQADRQMLSRGMQRSSYTGQTLANIGIQAAEAQQALWDEQVAAETNIDQQRAQLAQQLATQIAAYDAQQASDILARVQALEDVEYDRSVTAAQNRMNFASQLYGYLYQLGRDQMTDQEWMMNYLLNVHQQNTSQEQWYQEMNENMRQYNKSNAANQKAAYASGGGKQAKINTQLTSGKQTGDEQSSGGTQTPTAGGKTDPEILKLIGL